MDNVTWWTAFGAIGQAGGAAATFAAVALALWQVRSERSLRARFSAGIMVTFMGDGSPGTYHVGFNVLNTGLRSIRVSNIGWRTGWTSRCPKQLSMRYAIQRSSVGLGRQVPFVLEPTEDASVLTSIADFKLGAADPDRRSEFFARRRPLLGWAPIYATLFISGRRPIQFRVKGELADFLRNNVHNSTTADDE